MRLAGICNILNIEYNVSEKYTQANHKNSLDFSIIIIIIITPFIDCGS